LKTRVTHLEARQEIKHNKSWMLIILDPPSPTKSQQNENNLPLNVGETPLLLLKLETNNKLNTIELQTTVDEEGAWSMVKLVKLKGSSWPFGKSRA
jgi:hypothetical protein